MRPMRDASETQKQRFRELLRDLREETGLRQVDLAKRLNRPQSFVSKYESGEKTLDFFELREVCRALEISMNEFVRRFEKASHEG